MELSDRKKLMIVLSIVLFFIILIWSGMKSDDRGLPPLDPYNHKSVALHFVMKNGTISKRMGKVVQSSHIGNGGGGKVSYNVLKLTGDNKGTRTSGVCDLTLEKGEDEKYVATKAILTMKGTEYNISLKGFKGRKKSMSVR